MLSRNTLSHFRSSRIFHTGAFTLVEILVVIAVLVTTSTMAFVSYSEYSTSARDANRVTDLSAFQSGLESYRAKNGVLPEPTNAVRIQTGSTDIAYQGYVGADILQKLAVDRGGMDPKSGTYYTYLANWPRDRAQLLTFFENQEQKNAFAWVFDAAVPFARALSNNTKLYAATSGDAMGIFLSANTLSPIQEVYSGSVSLSTLVWAGTIVTNSCLTGSGTVVALSAGTSIDSCYVNRALAAYALPWVGATSSSSTPSTPSSSSSCSLAGSSIPHGSSVTAYQASSVPFGSSCTSESRICTNGVLSGTYTNGSCTVASASACTLPWGGSLAHSASTTAYQSSSVTYPSSCTSQTRTCTNGVLSGSYTNNACSLNYTYAWSSGSWWSCSASCGGGTQTRTVICQRNDGTTVSDALCSGTKPAVSQSCNTQACVTRYPGCDTDDIVLSNGQRWAACNAWASVAYTNQSLSYDYYYGPTFSQINYVGWMYQWGRNANVQWSPLADGATTRIVNNTTGPVASDSTLNFYTNAMGTYDANWLSSNNHNLWWGASSSTWTSASAGDRTSMQWPCASGYHVPTLQEWFWAMTNINSGITNSSSPQSDTSIRTTLKLPLVGRKRAEMGGIYNYNPGTEWMYWASTPWSTMYATNIFFNTSSITLNASPRSAGFSVRCMRN